MNSSKSNDRQIAYSQAVWEITSALQEDRSLESALRSSLNKTIRFIGAEAGTIWYYNKDGDGRIYPSYWVGGADLTGMSLAYGEGIAGKVVSSGKPLVITDCKNDSRWASRFDSSTGFVTKSMICVPLANKHEVIGCTQIINKKDGSLYTDEDISLTTALAELTAIAIESRGLNLGIFAKRTPLLSLRDITKDFGSGENLTKALRGVSLDVYEGEFLVILGKSGCGKSTLLNIIGGMDHSTSGSFTFDGRDLSNAGEGDLTEYRRHSLGFIFQAYNLINTLTVKENLDFIGGLSNDPIAAEEALGLVGLSDKADKYPTQLSGGQQQRVTIACALSKRPRIILADEPTAALDYTTSIDVLGLLRKAVQDGTTLIMVTHNEEIARMANRVIHIQDGVVSEVTINKYPASADELVW